MNCALRGGPQINELRCTPFFDRNSSQIRWNAALEKETSVSLSIADSQPKRGDSQGSGAQRATAQRAKLLDGLRSGGYWDPCWRFAHHSFSLYTCSGVLYPSD